MKYLKTHESFKDWTPSTYQKNDLVIIESDWLESIAKVINVLPSDNFKDDTEYKLECKTKISSDMINEYVIISAIEKEIVRKLTPSEIIEYNLREDAKKYNI
jgi:hypothetical protein